MNVLAKAGLPKRTMLCLACIEGNHFIVEFLMDIIRKRLGNTKLVEEVSSIPMETVVSAGHVETVRILLSFKETDRSYGSERSLLHLAIGNESLEMVKEILSDPYLLKDERKEYFSLRHDPSHGMTPLEYAIKHDYQEIIGVSCTPLNSFYIFFNSSIIYSFFGKNKMVV